MDRVGWWMYRREDPAVEAEPYPAQSHLRGLVAHLVLGVATDRLLAAGRHVLTR